MGEFQVVTFTISNEVFGVKTIQVDGISVLEKVMDIPQKPDFLIGVADIRGGKVPLVNMNVKFGIRETETKGKRKIILSKCKNMRFGFVVNDVREIMSISDSEFEPVPDVIRTATNSCITGVAKKGDRLISIVNFNGILSETEVEQTVKAMEDLDE